MSKKVVARVANTCVPESVTRAELLTAMQPLFDLLGVQAEHMMADSFQIRADEICFIVAGVAEDATSGPRLPIALPASNAQYSVWCAPVSVRIEST